MFDSLSLRGGEKTKPVCAERGLLHDLQVLIRPQVFFFFLSVLLGYCLYAKIYYDTFIFVVIYSHKSGKSTPLTLPKQLARWVLKS